MSDTPTLYAKLVNGVPRYAGKAIPTPRGFIAAPTPEQLREYGWLPVVDETPTTDETHYARPTGWTRDGETWRRVYDIRELPPPPPRTFSKYKLVAALMQAQVWPQVKAWIESVPGAYDLYLAAEDISEDEPLLAQGIAAVKELLSWTDEQVEAVLVASVQ